jgi:hypothetical protein
MTEAIDAYMKDADTTREIIPNEPKNNVRRRFPMTNGTLESVMDKVLDGLNEYVKDNLVKEAKEEDK